VYALEGFLARLSGSEYADRLVLKGGVLMAAFDARRPTRDIDLAAQAVSGEVEDVLVLVRRIAATDLQDGLVFEPELAQADSIRDEDQYRGVRVTLPCTLASARIRFHVDVNVGDPIRPDPRSVGVPRLLGGVIEVRGYPLAMVYAEKIVTMAERGLANTRWRDFADVYLLSRTHDQDGADLLAAISTVAGYRGAVVDRLAVILAGYPALAQPRWVAWRRRQLLEDRLPADFAEVLQAVMVFADPCLMGGPAPGTWDAAAGQWFGSRPPAPGDR